MIYFSFRFLLCNAIICIFLGSLLGLKNLLQRQLSACMQYNLSIIFLAVLIVPFLPINSAPSSISWRHLLTASSSTNGDIQTTFLSGNGYNLDKINDFAVSVSTQIPTFIHTLLVFFWSIGIFIMFFLLYRSVKQVKALHSSALPLQNEELNALYIECLNEVNSKHTIPIYSTAFLKSPVLAGFLHPRIYLPIHLISDFNAGTISATDIRYMLLHELQHYKHKDILIGYLINTVNVFYWFNPLIWYFLKRIRQERELACDSAVLQLLKETEYKSYGNTLINFAETIALSPFPLTMGISGNIKQLKGRILNIAYIFLRDGQVHEQPKIHPTANEETWWNVEGGDILRPIETDSGLIGVLICYDSEFPELARRLTDLGAMMLFVPFCTDERAGYLRVRYCCQARAVENQVYVVLSGNVGNLPHVKNMHIQYAQSCILTPSDFPFSRDGIAADSNPNTETVLLADLNIDALQMARANGTVQNLKDRRHDLYSVKWTGR